MTYLALITMASALALVITALRHEKRSTQHPYDAELRRCAEKLEREIKRK